jgi:hypothetical protein
MSYLTQDVRALILLAMFTYSSMRQMAHADDFDFLNASDYFNYNKVF